MVLNTGWINEKHKTGAATLEIHIDKKSETDMMESKMFLGLVPASAKMYEEITLAMLYFDKAAAKVKPPINTMMTDDHMAAKMYLEASAPSISEPSSFFKTLQVTTSKGTSMAVTYKGKASEAQSMALATKTAKQRCC